jgi:hypothetical protein
MNFREENLAWVRPSILTDFDLFCQNRIPSDSCSPFAMEPGLPLPDVVRELLKDPTILRWDPVEMLYQVIQGEAFEMRCPSSSSVVIDPKCLSARFDSLNWGRKSPGGGRLLGGLLLTGPARGARRARTEGARVAEGGCVPSPTPPRA